MDMRPQRQAPRSGWQHVWRPPVPCPPFVWQHWPFSPANCSVCMCVNKMLRSRVNCQYRKASFKSTSSFSVFKNESLIICIVTCVFICVCVCLFVCSHSCSLCSLMIVAHCWVCKPPFNHQFMWTLHSQVTLYCLCVLFLSCAVRAGGGRRHELWLAVNDYAVCIHVWGSDTTQFYFHSLCWNSFCVPVTHLHTWHSLANK